MPSPQPQPVDLPELEPETQLERKCARNRLLRDLDYLSLLEEHEDEYKASLEGDEDGD